MNIKSIPQISAKIALGTFAPNFLLVYLSFKTFLLFFFLLLSFLHIIFYRSYRSLPFYIHLILLLVYNLSLNFASLNLLLLYYLIMSLLIPKRIYVLLMPQLNYQMTFFKIIFFILFSI